jgi:hypothetical protein
MLAFTRQTPVPMDLLQPFVLPKHPELYGDFLKAFVYIHVLELREERAASLIRALAPLATYPSTSAHTANVWALPITPGVTHWLHNPKRPVEMVSAFAGDLISGMNQIRLNVVAADHDPIAGGIIL